MKTKIAITSLLLLVASVAASAQTLPVQVELGYRFTDIKGNEGMYRTQINEREGFVLRSLTFFTSGEGAFDHFRIDATDLGSSPAGALNLETGKQGRYNFRFGYRQFDAFSELPGYANPFFSQGVIPGQHTFDRKRTMFDADLELLPGGKIAPFIGFSYGRNNGPGTTTYDVGGDEFHLAQDLTDTDQEIRAGFTFNVSRFSGQVTQGWRRFKGDETLTLFPGAGAGNNAGPVLGQPVNATSITRNEKTDVDTPFTNLYVVADATSKVRLIGNFSRFAADQDGSESESAAGSFASFGISRFFTGLTETVDARAKNNTWRGGARAEIALTDRIDLLAGYEKDHRELEGSSLINTLYQNTITFTGADPKDITEILNTNTSLNRDEDVISANLQARAVGPFSLRAGFRQTKQEVEYNPDLEEIVVPGPSQSGNFDRTVNTFDASAQYGMNGLTLGAAWRHDTANDPILRTDFLNRDRYRLRAAYAFRRDLVRVGVTAEQIDQDNDETGIGYDGKSRQYAADLEVAPIQALRFRVAASQLKADSTILFRRPENFNIGTSTHSEKGDSIEGGVSVFVKKLMFDAAAARFENEGTIPFSIDRVRVRATYDFLAHTGIGAEWSKDKYEEDPFRLGNFDASRYGIFLRWNP